MSGQGRRHAVDRLRGFALLGVLIVNTPFLITSVAGISEISMPTNWDRTAGFITRALFQAKSDVNFSFIFGYSLTIFLERSPAVSTRTSTHHADSRRRAGRSPSPMGS